MDIKIEPMTREQMHEMYQAFQMDPMIFDDMELFEQVKNYVYNPEKMNMLYDMRMDEEGYGTQAEKLAIDYAFDVLGAESIFAESLIKNARSQHIMEKLGFRYFGENEGFKQYRLVREDRV